MTDSNEKLEVVIVLVNEGHATTAVGPIEVFSSAGAMFNELQGDEPDPRFRVTTVSIDGEPIESAFGLRIAPDCSLDDVGPADLVMVSASGPVPSEWMSRHAALLPWLVERRRQGSLLAGVCSGVGFLAEAGLLDGRRATTYWGVADAFRERYPEVDWQTDLLITEDGGLFCGGGGQCRDRPVPLSCRAAERPPGRGRMLEGAAARHATTQPDGLRDTAAGPPS